MKKLLIALLCVWFCFSGFAQNEISDKPKSSLSFDVGFGSRVTPIYPRGYQTFTFTPNPSIRISSHKNLTGFNINFGLRYKFWHKFFVGLRYVARYDHIGYQDFNFNTSFSGYKKDIKAFLSEFQTTLGMRVLKKARSEVFIAVGISKQNIGSDLGIYTTKISGVDTFYFMSQKSFDFYTLDINIGLERKRFAVDVNMYFAQQESIGFYDNSPFIVPELRFRYYISENLL